MKEVNVKEARKNLSSLLDKVERGEEVTITRRGKRVAQLVTPETADSRLPSLKDFRASIEMTGQPLSHTVTYLRSEQRH